MIEKKKFYINGSWVEPKNQNEIQVINPASEKSCAVISLGGKEDIHDAVTAAKEAFKSWGFTSKEERIAHLEKLYELYKKRWNCLLYTSPSPRDRTRSRMPSSA